MALEGAYKLVQYIVIRKDLLDSKNWSIGSLIAQGCHASTAALFLYKDKEHTIEYYENLANMHKVVLEVSDEDSLISLSDKLVGGGIDHKLWTEQPEGYCTSLACRPYPEHMIKLFFKDFKLFK